MTLLIITISIEYCHRTLATFANYWYLKIWSVPVSNRHSIIETPIESRRHSSRTGSWSFSVRYFLIPRIALLTRWSDHWWWCSRCWPRFKWLHHRVRRSLMWWSTSCWHWWSSCRSMRFCRALEYQEDELSLIQFTKDTESGQSEKLHEYKVSLYLQD